MSVQVHGNSYLLHVHTMHGGKIQDKKMVEIIIFSVIDDFLVGNTMVKDIFPTPVELIIGTVNLGLFAANFLLPVTPILSVHLDLNIYYILIRHNQFKVSKT